MVSRLFLALILFFSVIIVLPRTANAADESGQQAFSVVPVPDADPATTDKGYFVYQLEPGGHATGTLQLRNIVSQTVTVVLEVAAAETAQKGGSSFSQVGEALTGMATWIKLAAPSVTLAPDEVRDVPFSVMVPQGISPSQYLAGISAYVLNVPATAGAGDGADRLGATINFQVRRVIAVEVDVPGDWQSSLQIPEVSLIDQPSGISLGIHMSNDGATFLKPSGTLTISDAAGKQLAQQQISMGTFVPGTSVVYPVALASRPAPGSYNVSVAMDYGTAKVAHYEKTLAVSDKAVAAAPANVPIDLSGGQAAPAAPAVVPAVAPAATAASASDGGDMIFWLTVVGGLALAVVSVGLVVVTIRRQEAAQ